MAHDVHAVVMRTTCAYDLLEILVVDVHHEPTHEELKTTPFFFSFIDSRIRFLDPEPVTRQLN